MTFEEAKALSSYLLEDGLVACANIIGPIVSLYKWQDEVKHAQEYKLLLKTKMNCWKKIEKLITKNHSYSIPEISLLSIEAVSDAYGKWLNENLLKS